MSLEITASAPAGDQSYQELNYTFDRQASDGADVTTQSSPTDCTNLVTAVGNSIGQILNINNGSGVAGTVVRNGAPAYRFSYNGSNGSGITIKPGNAMPLLAGLPRNFMGRLQDAYLYRFWLEWDLTTLGSTQDGDSGPQFQFNQLNNVNIGSPIYVPAASGGNTAGDYGFGLSIDAAGNFIWISNQKAFATGPITEKVIIKPVTAGIHQVDFLFLPATVSLNAQVIVAIDGVTAVSRFWGSGTVLPDTTFINTTPNMLGFSGQLVNTGRDSNAMADLYFYGFTWRKGPQSLIYTAV